MPFDNDHDGAAAGGTGKRRYARLRAMYVGGRGNRSARRYSRWWNRLLSLGLLPRRWVTLEVSGRRSGRPTRFPLGMADIGGTWYLVSMLGECNWVRNVRAADGDATLRRRRAQLVHLDELPVEQRAPVLKRYVERVPGARPHIPLDRDRPVADFEHIVADYPVFRVTPLSAPSQGR